MGMADWQPNYAAAGLAIFPVTPDKRPAVKGYLNVGLRGSRALAEKFANAAAFGFALGPRSGITVLDIDAPDERILADALDRHGRTPLIVRSGSGNFQAWYRHNGESRRVRPDPSLPIDLLGSGFVVAPPSNVSKGDYSFVSGSLDDLPDLPTMTDPERVSAAKENAEVISPGRRNATLLPQFCLRLDLAYRILALNRGVQCGIEFWRCSPGMV